MCARYGWVDTDDCDTISNPSERFEMIVILLVSSGSRASYSSIPYTMAFAAPEISNLLLVYHSRCSIVSSCSTNPSQPSRLWVA